MKNRKRKVSKIIVLLLIGVILNISITGYLFLKLKHDERILCLTDEILWDILHPDDSDNQNNQDNNEQNSYSIPEKQHNYSL